jgi:hypothetical protein
MDDLQEQLAAIASDAASTAEPAGQTFLRMAALAAPGRRLRTSERQGDPPRLTENWFC